MKTEELKKISDYTLEQEMERRNKIKQEKQNQEDEKKRMSQFMNRPACSVVGKAHGSPFYSNEVQEMPLGRIYIEGNSGKSYSISAPVCHSVKVYFHNVWSDSDRAQFEKECKQLARKWITEKCKDPFVVASLICLSEQSGCRPLKGNQIKVYNEWHKEAIERLSKYTLKELEDTLDRFKKDSFNDCHGQSKLLLETIKMKKQNKFELSRSK